MKCVYARSDEKQGKSSPAADSACDGLWAATVAQKYEYENVNSEVMKDKMRHKHEMQTKTSNLCYCGR